MENIKIVILVSLETLIMCLIFYFGFRRELNSFSVFNFKVQPQIQPALSVLFSDLFLDPLGNNTPKKDVRILTIALSAVSKYERRMWIRKTWWMDCRQSEEITCLFMTDNLEHIENKTLANEVRKEIAKEGDMIVSPIPSGILFGYRFLFLLQWGIKHYNFDYIMRIDDDMLLCVDHLLHELPMFPMSYFHWGSLHCHGRDIVYIDEGITIFSKDIVKMFLNQSPRHMLCHPFGDQTFTIWIQEIGLNCFQLYHVDTRIHHDPPASQVANLKSMENICDKYIALHGVYHSDMSNFWGRRGHGNYSKYKFKNITELCEFPPHYRWDIFEGIYRHKPSLCTDQTQLLKMAGKPYQGREV